MLSLSPDLELLRANASFTMCTTIAFTNFSPACILCAIAVRLLCFDVFLLAAFTWFGGRVTVGRDSSLSMALSCLFVRALFGL